MPVGVQGGGHRQLEPQGALFWHGPSRRAGRIQPRSPLLPTLAGSTAPLRAAGTLCPAAARTLPCLLLAQTRSASLVHSHPCSSLAHSSGSRGKAPETDFR